MDNFVGENDSWVQRMYDLKGSTFQRISINPKSSKSVRKDLNFLEETEYRMHVGEETH